jgi:gliding motility-associated-like protein
MPISTNAFQSTTTGFDFYLMVLERDFLGLLYATYIGGPVAQEHVDGGTSRFDKNGVVYQSVCGGCGANSDFPTSPGAWSATNNSSNCNNLIFKFDFQLIPYAQFSTNSTIGCEDFQVTFQNFSSLSDEYLWDFGNNNTTSTIFNPTILYSEPGQYDVYLYVTDSVCLLTDTAYISITVLDSITFNLLDTINLCSSVPYTLNVSPNGTNNTYIWSLNSNFSSPLNAPQNSSILVSQAGMYYVSVSNGICSRVDSVFVAFDIPITADFSLDVSSGCTPLQVQFDNSSSVTTDFYWDFGNGLVDSVNYNPIMTYTSPGQYQVQLIISDSICNGSDTAYYTINVAPAISAVLDDVIYLCNNTAITISPLVTGLATSFIWSSNAQFSDTLNTSILDTSLLLINPQATTYYFQANNGVCSIVDSVEVQIFSDQLTMIAPSAICLGETGIVSISNSSSETFTYSWSPLNCILNPNNGPSVNVQPTFSQYIYVEATSANNCIVNDSIFIQVSYLDPSLVLASAQPNLILPGAQVSLLGAPSGMNSYSWSPSIGLVNPLLQNTSATVETTTIFTLTVSNGVCTRSDTTLVRVYEIICDAPYIFVPNAFSPNGDGNNDILYVRGIWVEKIIFRIFDRWGELVFESNSIANGWDGTFKDQKLPPDVYDYYLDITCVGGQQTITKGNVTLMK